MRRQFSLPLLLIALVLFSTCDTDGPVGPGGGPVEVSVTGTATFPSTTGLNLSTVTVSAAESEAKLETGNAFSVKATTGAPALVIAAGTDSIPLLLGVVTDPAAGTPVQLNAASTALALVYLSPPICAGVCADGEAVATKIKSLAEFQTLVALLTQKLTANPKVLSTEDLQLETALSNVITAYINSLPTIPNPTPAAGTASRSKSASLKKSSASTRPSATSGDVVIIQPSTLTGGHLLRRKEGDKYILENWYGRWVYCISPEEEFFAFPNGSFLDVLRFKTPWAASERELMLSPPVSGNPIQLNVYGLGWKEEPTNTWDALTDTEKNYVMRAAFSTIAFEFVPHILSTITNTAKAVDATTVSKDAYLKALSFLFKDTRNYDRYVQYLKEKKFEALTWYVAKSIISKLIVDEEFRKDYLPAILMNLSAGRIATLAKWLHIGLKGMVIFDGVTSTVKTWWGTTSSRYKTTFRIHRETSNFGNLSGSVNDKTTGAPIEGAIVDIKGDDNNPLNPPHRVTTGANGGFYFENLLEGQKTVEVSKTGYASNSQSVTITRNATVSIAIPLSKESGKLTGRVLNDIYVKNNVTPATMKGECFLELFALPSGTSQGTFWVYDGNYSVTVPPGTYSVVAWQKDYVADTVQAVVQKDGTSSAPDLTLQPMGMMKGKVYVDMDMDGTYELQFDFADSTLACLRANDFGTCPNGTRGPVIWIGNWPPIVGLDAVSLVLDPNVVNQAGAYDIGGIDMIACPTAGIAASVDLRTNRRFCQHPSGASGAMAFTFVSGGQSDPCNCGIDKSGTVYLTDYGSELTSVIAGGFTAQLAGWTHCECDGGGKDNCARAYVDINFRMLLGAQ